MKTYHVDGGAFIEPPDYKFHDAYITVCNDKGKVIHFNKNIGDVNNVVAERKAIQWVIKNRKSRPIRITSDCQPAMSQVRKSLNPLLDGEIEVVYSHNNIADQWNARNHSPKYDRAYYIRRHKETGKKYKMLDYFPKKVD